MQKAADAKSQAEKELNSAKDALAQAEKELNAVKEELQNVKDAAAAEQSKDTADQTGEAEKKDTNSTRRSCAGKAEHIRHNSGKSY